MRAACNLEDAAAHGITHENGVDLRAFAENLYARAETIEQLYGKKRKRW